MDYFSRIITGFLQIIRGCRPALYEPLANLHQILRYLGLSN